MEIDGFRIKVGTFFKYNKIGGWTCDRELRGHELYIQGIEL